jgi:hypothetical protein
MSTINPNEAPEGYMAVEIDDMAPGHVCMQCAFIAVEPSGHIGCGNLEAACFGDRRADKTAVVFVKKPTKGDIPS